MARPTLGSCVMRSAGFSVFLIGSPVNVSDCLIGSPVTSHCTAGQVLDSFLSARQFGDTDADVREQLEMLVAAVPEWASIEQPTALQPRVVVRVNRNLGANVVRRKVEEAVSAARSQAAGDVTSPLAATAGARPGGTLAG